MNPQNESEDSEKSKKRFSLSSWFVTREEPDEDYMPDLRTQWEQMRGLEKVKFVLGAVVGLLIFLGALYLVFLILRALRGL